MKKPALFFNHISDTDRVIFTKHLAVMVKAGIPLAEALGILTKQSPSPQIKQVLEQIAQDVSGGKKLSQAMEKHEQDFGQFYTSLIKVSEESGTLESNLNFLAEQLAKDLQLKKKIQGALLYPGLILSSTIILGGFIAIFILPKLVDFFGAFDIDLPLPTRILLFVATIFQTHGIAILISIAILIVGFLSLIKLPKIKPIWHAFLLKVPLFGKLILFGQLARFSRNFGILLQSGVPVEKSLNITADTLSNLKFKHDLQFISKKASTGQQISNAIEKTVFPSLVAQMVAIGEKTGRLDETVIYLADFYEEEIDNISKNLSTILEPALMVGVGIIVGFVALAIIGPIYELTGSIR